LKGITVTLYYIHSTNWFRHATIHL